MQHLESNKNKYVVYCRNLKAKYIFPKALEIKKSKLLNYMHFIDMILVNFYGIKI